MAGTIEMESLPDTPNIDVSMESGLDGRNNSNPARLGSAASVLVSMESGLDGRNNKGAQTGPHSWRSPSQWSPA